MKTLTRYTAPNEQLSRLIPCGDHVGKFTFEAYRLFLQYDEEDLTQIVHLRNRVWSDIMTDGTKVYAVWAEGPLTFHYGRVLLLELEYSDCKEVFDEATMLYENILEDLKFVVSEGIPVCDAFGNFGEFAEANGGYDPEFCKVVFEQNADELEDIYQEDMNRKGDFC